MLIGLCPLHNCTCNWLDEFDKRLKSILEDESLFLVKAPDHFRADIKETGDMYVIEAELPGFTKDEISIELSGDCLTIKAHRRGESDRESDKNRVIRQERYFGKWIRRFHIDNVQEDKIKAKLENGILTIEIPKANPEKPPAIRIPIE